MQCTYNITCCVQVTTVATEMQQCVPFSKRYCGTGLRCELSTYTHACPKDCVSKFHILLDTSALIYMEQSPIYFSILLHDMTYKISGTNSLYSSYFLDNINAQTP